MQAVTTTVALVAAPLAAETITCVMQDGRPLDFTIDYNQFAPALNADEPPQQRRSFVRFGAQDFAAAPFRLGDVRGFEADEPEGGIMLFVLQPTGDALLSITATQERLSGTCQISEGSQ